MSVSSDSVHEVQRTVSILGYLLFIGGFTDMCVAFMLMITTKPQFVGQSWAGLWYVAVAFVGFMLMFANRKAWRFRTKGRMILGQVFAQFGILLSGGFILWLADTSWGGLGLGVAFLVGSVVLFLVGMLIASVKTGSVSSRYSDPD
jgi:hypothetical protein